MGNHPDSDGDGFTDGWETIRGYDATDPASPEDFADPNFVPNSIP